MRISQVAIAFILAGQIESAVAVGAGHLGNLSGATFNIGNTHLVDTSFPKGSSFSDVYWFDISQASVTVGTGITIELDVPSLPGPEFALSNFQVQFTDSIGNPIMTEIQSSSVDTSLSISALLAPAVSYQFVVSGIITGSLGASYGGVLQAYPLTVAYPIPEADNYMLLALGMGLVGWLSRRRV